MAGDWIKMTHELPDKPEVLAISGRIGINRLEVVGRLFILWRWFDQHTVDGNALGVTKVTLSECLFGYSSDTKFIEAVIAEGWLIETSEGISVVNFEVHISESAKQRALTAKRVAKSKEKGNGKGNAASVNKVTRPALPDALPREDINSNPPITPQGGKKAAIEFKTFLADCKAKGEKPISDYQPALAYAQSIGLPLPVLELCWNEFYRRHAPGGASESKRYKDWRKAFRNCLEGNWYKLWWHNPESNAFELTSAGRTAEKVAA